MSALTPSCVRLIDVGKSFFGVEVLRDVNLDFRQGEIHGIVGENGAGKSTVGKIIGGYYTRSSGDLEVFGEKVGAWTRRLALGRGIAMIHQELQLVPELTVAQNVFLGIEHNRGGAARRRREPSTSRESSRHCGFGLDAARTVGDLRIADQQKVEIMRAIARDARVIIMDEPTSSLTADEAERLHQTIAGSRADGPHDHLRLAFPRPCAGDLRPRHGDARRRAWCAPRTPGRDQGERWSRPCSARRRRGRLSRESPPPSREPLTPLLEVEGAEYCDRHRRRRLEIRPGEIVGLIGLVGSGRTRDRPRHLRRRSGDRRARARRGRAAIDDRSPRALRRTGIAWCPRTGASRGWC